nr:unnamed protein product [Digitaria exilis]
MWRKTPTLSTSRKVGAVRLYTEKEASSAIDLLSVVGFHQEHTCMQTETSQPLRASFRLGVAVHDRLAASFGLAGSEEMTTGRPVGTNLYVV